MAGRKTDKSPGLLEFLVSEPVNLPQVLLVTAVRENDYPFSLAVQWYRRRLNCPVSYVKFQSEREGVLRYDLESRGVFSQSMRIVVLQEAPAVFVRTLFPADGTYVLAELPGEQAFYPEWFTASVRNWQIKILIYVLRLPYTSGSLRGVAWRGTSEYWEVEAVLRLAKAAHWTIDELIASRENLDWVHYFQNPRAVFDVICRRGPDFVMRELLDNLVRAVQYRLISSAGVSMEDICRIPGLSSFWVNGDMSSGCPGNGKTVRGMSLSFLEILVRRMVFSDRVHSVGLTLDWLLLSILTGDSA